MAFFSSSHEKKDLSLMLRFRAYLFKRQRREYYEYLSMIMTASMGMKTMRDIFRDDAARYGKKSHRGVLSHHWEQKISENGDIAETLRGTLPDEDVNFIALLQSAGGGIMESGLADLSHLIKVQEQLGAIMKRFFLAAGFAIGLVVGMMFILGYFLIPEIQGSFSSIDPVYYKKLSRRLFALGEAVKENGFYYLAGIAALLGATPFVLAQFTGKVRLSLDKYGVFRLYRSIHSIRFILNLATLIKERSGSENISLTRAISMLKEGETPWMQWHLNQMLDKISVGDIGVETFDTGLFDQDVIWFLEDMTDVVGLDDALQLSKGRLESHTISDLARKATILTWTLLLTAVVSMLASYLWVMGVINEMTSLMKLGMF